VHIIDGGTYYDPDTPAPALCGVERNYRRFHQAE